MKITIASKNFNPSDKLKATIENKISKLDKYFNNEAEASIMCSEVKTGLCKLEATIRAGKLLFRAEESSNDIYYCLDKVIDKLSKQMSKYKNKLVKKHHDQKEILFDQIPETAEGAPADEPIGIVRIKRFTLNPMTPDEAILQMELLEHSFFVFRDGETGKTCVVYKREDEGTYGLLETE
jgi:putative sigma-54 modulation protein